MNETPFSHASQEKVWYDVVITILSSTFLVNLKLFPCLNHGVGGDSTEGWYFETWEIASLKGSFTTSVTQLGLFVAVYFNWGCHWGIPWAWGMGFWGILMIFGNPNLLEDLWNRHLLLNGFLDVFRDFSRTPNSGTPGTHTLPILQRILNGVVWE